jgi:hypothetical protein
MATAEDGLPNGHAAGDWRVLQCFSKRGFHIIPAERNTIFRRLSNVFLPWKKQPFSGLVGGADGGRLSQA